MASPRYCECGRKIVVKFHPGRNPHSRKNKVSTAPSHDLCHACWRVLMRRANG